MVLPATGPEVNWRLDQNQHHRPRDLLLVDIRIARAAPGRLGAAAEGRGGEAVGQVVVDGPRLVVVARKGDAVGVAAAPGLGRQRVVVAVARLDGLADDGLFVPPAGWLAAVPVPVTHAIVSAASALADGGMRRETDLVVWPVPEDWAATPATRPMSTLAERMILGGRGGIEASYRLPMISTMMSRGEVYIP